MSHEEMVEVSVDFLGQTARAILVSDGDQEIWLPKSQIEYDDDLIPRGQMIDIEIPLWLAEENGLV